MNDNKPKQEKNEDTKLKLRVKENQLTGNSIK